MPANIGLRALHSWRFLPTPIEGHLMLDTSRRTAFNDDHEAFRDSVRRFFDK